MGRLRDLIGNRTDEEADGDASEDDRGALALAEEIAEHPQTVTLRDGRQLGYAECGDPAGVPLVLCHGFPNSRVFGALFDAVGREQGVRVITPDRPGMGVSDPDPERSLTDWPEDVRDLLDELGVAEAAVLGISGGGPYAAVTAAMLPERVTRAGIVCGLAPVASVGLRVRLWYYAARFVPPASKLALWLLVRRARADREAFLASLADGATDADAPLWTGEVGQVIHASIVEACRRHGVEPLVRETAIYGSPWGFDLADVDVPVTLWYGKADVLVPPEMGLFLARELPTAEAHLFPDLDHLSTFRTHEAWIFRTMAGIDPARQ